MSHDSQGDERLRLIAEGDTLTLAEAVRELFACVDDHLRGTGQTPRPPNAHGGCYLDRWRFERLRRAYQRHVGYDDTKSRAVWLQGKAHSGEFEI